MSDTRLCRALHRPRTPDDGPRDHSAGAARRPLSLTLVRAGRKSRSVTPTQLYNPHSRGGAATRLRPTGFIRTEPALATASIIGGSADETLFVGRHELHSDLRDVTENRPNFCGVTSACRSSKKLALSFTFTASRCARLITAVREQM